MIFTWTNLLTQIYRNLKTFSASGNGIASKYNIMMGGIESAVKKNLYHFVDDNGGATLHIF